MKTWIGVGVMAMVVAAVLCALVPRVALADGDPGSDVLVNQNLFVAGDAGVSVAQQEQLEDLLDAAGQSHFPVRVAIIATRSDMGAVTALWRQPRVYAAFLGTELSLAYTQRLLVVMPDGFGLYWLKHASSPGYRALSAVPIKPGGAGLVAAAESGVRSLADAAGVKIGSTSAAGAGLGGAASSPAASSVTPATANVSPAATGAVAKGPGTDSLVAAVAAALAAGLALFFGVRYIRSRPLREGTGPTDPAAGEPRPRRVFGRLPLLPSFGVSIGVLGLATVVVLSSLGGSAVSQREELETNPYLDPGTTLSSRAPNFTLDDQFGRPISLSSFRGKVVLLAFTDSECTTICPMTTTAMLDAKAMLGKAGSQVQLLGVDANPGSTSLEDVWSYSQLHGMLHQWHFLTGSLAQLKRVWKHYGIEADIQRGLISHTPALVLIAPDGREAKVYITQQSYAAVAQFGQVLAREISSLLPDRPAVHSDLSYAPVPPINPSESVSLPRPGGGTVRLGPGSSARLYVFFATWDQEVTSLAGQLDALNAYESTAAAQRLPPLTAVDEGVVEPSSVALAQFLRTLPHPLSYPVGVDASGRVADGYEVLGEPWFVLISPTGQILWYQQVSTSGWPTDLDLINDVKSALTHSPKAPSSSAAIQQDLAGSPAPLAAVHAQAGQLLGSGADLAARIRALRGYPIVLNAWATWCPDCVAEFKMFATASAEYGRRVAFLGADTDDSPGDARSFLTQHPVGYPSYQATSSDLNPWAVIEGLPTTIYINPAGKVVHVQSGEYFSQGSLDGDIENYALGAGG